MRSALYLTPKLPYPPVDGGRIVSWNLARCLQHNGYEVDLVSFASAEGEVDEHAESLGEVLRSVTASVKDVRRQYPADLVRALVSGDSYFVRKYRSEELLRLLEHRLDEREYDLTVLESAYMGVYAPELAARAERTGHTMLRLQNVEYEIFDRLARFERRPLFRRLLEREADRFRAFEAELYRTVADVRAITPRDAENASRLAGRPIGFLEATVDCEAYTPGEAGDVEPASVVCIGDLSWPPNRNGVLWFHENVWPRVVDDHPQARCYVVGNHPPPEVRALESDHTTVTGYVDDDAAYFRRGHLFVVPLLEGSGIRIKILTALAMGRPVLSTHVGAEGVAYEGVLRADEPAAWIDAIGRAFATPPAIDRDAVEHVRRHHHWRRTVEFQPAGPEPEEAGA